MARHRVLVPAIEVRVLDREFSDYRREHPFATSVNGRIEARWISLSEALALWRLRPEITKIVLQASKQKAPQPEG